MYLEGGLNRGLRRVDDEVAQSEAEAHGGPTQAQRFGPRPGERLLLQLEQGS